MVIIDIGLVERQFGHDWRAKLDWFEVKHVEAGECSLGESWNDYKRPVLMVDLDEYQAAVELEMREGLIAFLATQPKPFHGKDLTAFLRARPALTFAIQQDVVACSGPGGQISKCESLVFEHNPNHTTPYCVHYGVCIEDDPTQWGSTVDCTEEDYQAGLAWGLDAKSQGFE